MTSFLLPRTSINTYKHICCKSSDDAQLPIISNSLSAYLCDIKHKIDNHEKDWDIYKRYTNPYEYVHTVIPFKKKCIALHKPLSRSYFKMIEIMQLFNIRFESPIISSFHLAEGPGGFIEALSDLRNCKEDTYVGMTLLDDNSDPNIPAWKKSEHFLRQHKNVIIETGADKTGNLLVIDNLKYCKTMYASSMDLITADGGFDFSIDFNNQEINVINLLFAQVCFALTMQKLGGKFILKIFDCFMHHTVDLLYILAAFYEKVHIVKPKTSRYANSEKYVVCEGFLFNSCESFSPFLEKAFELMSSNIESTKIKRLLNINISYLFLTKIEECNAIFGQQQIENIHYTISLIDAGHKHDKIDMLIKTNIKKCVSWCNSHNIATSSFEMVNNIFLTPHNSFSISKSV